MQHLQPAPANRRPSWRLILLTCLVLLAHWAVLRAAPLSLAAHANSGDSANDWSFATRTLAAPLPSGEGDARTAKPSTAPAMHTPARARTTPPPGPPPGPPPAPPTPRETAIDAASASVASTAQDEPGNTNASTEDAASASHNVTDEAPMQLAAASVPSPLPAPAETSSAASSSAPVAAKAVHRFAYPPSTRLKYDVKGEIKGFPYHVNGELLWVQDGKTYDARMEISHFLLGSRIQTSTGQLTPQGLEPARFGDKVKSEVAAHFDYSKNVVTFSVNTPNVPLQPGAQDQLSVLLQLGAMIGGEPDRFVQGNTLPMQAVGPRSAEAWVFTVGTSEKLSLPGGETQALRLWRDPIGEFGPKLEVWLAPGLGYLPVRIRLTQSNGDVIDQQWQATQKP